MIHTPQRLAHLLLCFLLLLEQPVFAQTIDLSQQLSGILTYSSTALRASGAGPTTQDTKFRPLHLRSISYDSHNNDFKLLLDKGDTKLYNSPNSLNSLNSLNSPNSLNSLNSQDSLTPELQNSTQELLKYFFIGLSLPNDKFWVNLRPDSPDTIIDDDLAKTDIGKIFLEADVQLKKDTASFTSPQTKEGKEYWDKLYKKAEELFSAAGQNITIPTLTRPWIVPNEIIIRESPESAYIYKATLKVMLEEDYLSKSQAPSSNNQIIINNQIQNSKQYAFTDPRLKELNEYSTKLIKETIIPKLTYEVNTSKRYAPLRQVYYSLILAQWFKARYRSQLTVNPSTVLGADSGQLTAQTNPYLRLIDSRDLTNLISKESYSKQTYFQQYQQSFKDGEYNIQEPIYTPYGQSIRRYMSGGITVSSTIENCIKISSQLALPPIGSKYIFPARAQVFPLWQNIINMENNAPSLSDIELLKNKGDADTVMNILRNERFPLSLRRSALSALIEIKDISNLRSIIEKSRSLDVFCEEAIRGLIQIKALDALKEVIYNFSRDMVKVFPGKNLNLLLSRNLNEIDIKNILQELLRISGIRIEIEVHEIASVRAANGLINAIGAGKDGVIIGFTGEVNESQAKKQFRGFKVENVLDRKENRILVEFWDKGLTRIDSRIGLQYHPFKFFANREVSGEEIERIKSELNIGQRKIFVIGSPSNSDLREFSEVYNQLYEEAAVKERPLVIIASRERKDSISPNIYSFFRDSNLEVRNNPDADFPNMQDANVLILNTSGELLKVYAIGDVCIVGEDRNIMEPAGQGKASLYFGEDKYWFNNLEAKKILEERGGALIFSKDNLELLINDRERNVAMGNKGFETAEYFRKEVIPQAGMETAIWMFFDLYFNKIGKGRIEAFSSASSAVEENESNIKAVASASKVKDILTGLNSDNEILRQNAVEWILNMWAMRAGSFIHQDIGYILERAEYYYNVNKDINIIYIDDYRWDEKFPQANGEVIRLGLNLRERGAIQLIVLLPKRVRDSANIQDRLAILHEYLHVDYQSSLSEDDLENMFSIERQIIDEIYAYFLSYFDLYDTYYNSISFGTFSSEVLPQDIYYGKVLNALYKMKKPSLSEEETKEEIKKALDSVWTGKLGRSREEIKKNLKNAKSLQELINLGANIVAKENKSSSPSIPQANKDIGGIAFNALPIQTQALPGVSSAAKFITHNSQFITSSKDLDSEWAQIQQIFNAGIRPSIDRINHYALAASASPLAEEKRDDVRGLLADILRRDEESEKLIPAEKACKELLKQLESG